MSSLYDHRREREEERKSVHTPGTKIVASKSRFYSLVENKSGPILPNINQISCYGQFQFCIDAVHVGKTNVALFNLFSAHFLSLHSIELTHAWAS